MRYLIIVTSALLFSACAYTPNTFTGVGIPLTPELQYEAEEAVKEDLVDPESANFRDFRAVKGRATFDERDDESDSV